MLSYYIFLYFICALVELDFECLQPFVCVCACDNRINVNFVFNAIKQMRKCKTRKDSKKKQQSSGNGRSKQEQGK